MARKNGRASMARQLHRSMGALAAIFVVFMVLSGLAINHSAGLSLKEQTVSTSLLLDHYGLEAPRDIRSFSVGDDWLSFAGSQVYLNEKNVSSLGGGIGAVANEFAIVVAGTGELLMLDHQGTLIERMPWELPGTGSTADSSTGSIESIGLLAGKQVIVESAGNRWLADEELLDWQNAEELNTEIAWATPAVTPAALRTTIISSYRGEGLSMERLLLDFHSGRIFGPIGVLIYDLLALAVGGLAISGLVFWMQGRRNNKSSRKGNRSKR